MKATFKHEGETNSGMPYGPIHVESEPNGDGAIGVPYRRETPCECSRSSLGPDGSCQECGGYVWLTLDQAKGWARHFGHDLEQT